VSAQDTGSTEETRRVRVMGAVGDDASTSVTT
jgi:hypothetical protein